jgi:MFS family permease
MFSWPRIGVSTAVGPLLGGVLIQLAGVQAGWRWVFLVNLFIGAAAVPIGWPACSWLMLGLADAGAG